MRGPHESTSALQLVREAPGEEASPATRNAPAVTLNDFYAYLPAHSYMLWESREFWPAGAVNSQIAPVGLLDAQGQPVLDEHGKAKFLTASATLDRTRAVEQITWAPGKPMLISDNLIHQGGWIPRPGFRVFNLYRPPNVPLGAAAKAGPWLDHLERTFPSDKNHILSWFAHRVQRPDEKINHALVLLGLQGTGKDTTIQGAIPAIGPWNVNHVSPDQLLGRFNGFIKSVVLIIEEARDLDADRYRFYDHTKTLCAAPPDFLRCDEKHMKEVNVPNVTGVIITSNYTDAIYLPPDDRRHYVAKTDCTKDHFDAGYWTRLYQWYENGGYGHVAAYLHSVDLSEFNPKAPPPKTPAFWAVVDAGRAPEDAELSDALDLLGNPRATTLALIAGVANTEFKEWLQDRRNSRQMPHRLEALDYTAVRNDSAKDGLWKFAGKRQVIYALRELSVQDRIAAARKLVEDN